MWTHRDLKERVFTFHDLMDAHEFLDNKAANKRAVDAWVERQRKR